MNTEFWVSEKVEVYGANSTKLKIQSNGKN